MIELTGLGKPRTNSQLHISVTKRKTLQCSSQQCICMDVYGCMWLSLWKLAPKTDAVMLRMINVAVYRCDELTYPCCFECSPQSPTTPWSFCLSNILRGASQVSSILQPTGCILTRVFDPSFMWSSGALCSDPHFAQSRTVHSPLAIRQVTKGQASLGEWLYQPQHSSFLCVFLHIQCSSPGETEDGTRDGLNLVSSNLSSVFFLRPIWGPPSQISYDLFKILSWYQWKTPRKTPQSASFSIAPPEFQHAPSHTPKQGLVNILRLAQILETGSMVDLSWNKFVYSNLRLFV